MVLLALSSLVNGLTQIHVEQFISLFVTLVKLEVNSSTISDVPDRLTENILMLLSFLPGYELVIRRLLAEEEHGIR